MKFCGYSLQEERGLFWHHANTSMCAKGSKGGIQYILKQYAPYPQIKDNPDLGTELAGYERLLNRVRNVNKVLMQSDGGRGMVAHATEVLDQHAGDPDGIIEVVPFVKGSQDLTQFTGNQSNRLALVRSMAAAMQCVHSAGVRHGDLKPGNVLYVSAMGTVKAIIIDFDHSYMEHDVPDGNALGGEYGYIAPETVRYAEEWSEFTDEYAREMKRPEGLSAAGKSMLKQVETLRRMITRKADIFSLGVLMHYVLCNQEQPAWGENQNRIPSDSLKATPYLYQLLSAMMCADPDERPDIDAVLETLKTGEFEMTAKLVDEPWEEHAKQYRLNPAGDGRRKVHSIRRIVADGYKQYCVKYDGYPARNYDLGMMLLNKLLISSDAQPEALTQAGSSELWDAEAAYRVDQHRLHAFDYQRVERITYMGMRVYRFIRNDGSEEIKAGSMAVTQGFFVLK